MKFTEVTNYNVPEYKRFFESKKRDIVLYGGAGSGKSYAVADKFCLEVLRQDIKNGVGLKFLVVRRSFPSLRRTCIPTIESRFKKIGIPFVLNRQDEIAKVGNHSEIYFISCNNKDDYEKIKSITDVDFIWLEEANEIPLEPYESIIKLRLRGGKGLYAQRIFTFNPISQFIWLYDYHFINNYDKALKVCVNIEHNRFKDLDFEKELDDLKNQNLNLYKVYRLGEFGSREGIIYGNCKTTKLIPKSADIIYGLDFGFNNPTALIEETIYDKTYYEEEMLYERGLTNTALIDKLNELIPDKDYPIYCDCAEPARIKEIRDAGFNALLANKDVMFGIDYCQRQKIFMHEDSLNLIKENDAYSWQIDKDGKKIDKPVKFNDHLMDARRYAIFTHGEKGDNMNRVEQMNDTYEV